MNYGDIVLIAHYATEMHCLKIRPALIISSKEYNTRETDRILLPISSNITRASPDDILITDKETAFKTTGLKVSSAIRAGKIFTSDISLVKRKIGQLGDKKLNKVREKIKKTLDLK